MNRTEQHPVFRIVRFDQGRSLVWLARETGFSYGYVRMVAANLEKGSPRFRAACARVLGLPESVLFHGGSSDASPSEDAPDTGSDDQRAATAVVSLSVARA